HQYKGEHPSCSRLLGKIFMCWRPAQSTLLQDLQSPARLAVGVGRSICVVGNPPMPRWVFWLTL
ncbi:MAG: hypothetical protein OYH77_03760, partial [Pseudomonadota bacterium]|nr:hypothetical protein [Pseudomonadota bacterium]